MKRNHWIYTVILLLLLITILYPTPCHNCYLEGMSKPYTPPAVTINASKAILLHGFVEKVEVINCNSDILPFEKSHYKLEHTPQNVVVVKYHIQPKRGAIMPFDAMVPLVVIEQRQITSNSSSKRFRGTMFVVGEEVILVTDQWKLNGRSGELHIEISRNRMKRTWQVFKRYEEGDISKLMFFKHSFANTVSDNSKIRYWLSLYLLSDTTISSGAHHYIANDMVTLPPFQKRHEGYKLYKKMINENFPNYSKFKLRQLYRKHFYRTRW